MPPSKSLAVRWRWKLEELKALYRRDGINLDEIKQAYNDLINAQEYLTRINNDQAHPRFAEKKRVVDSQQVKDLASKWKHSSQEGPANPEEEARAGANHCRDARGS